MLTTLHISFSYVNLYLAPIWYFMDKYWLICFFPQNAQIFLDICPQKIQYSYIYTTCTTKT